MKTKSLFLAALVIAPSILRAQIITDGATNTVISVPDIIGDVTVGTNGSFTLLILSGNALLTNSANGIISRNATARTNEVRLVSPNARWQMGGSLFVGSNGALSRLVVSNGAFVNNNNGILGNGASSSNNLALVTGSGSFWSNRIDLTVGSSGRDNQMTVSNGARVASRVGNLGSQPGSSNNLVVVTGSGSSWTNHSDVNVGIGDRGNRLVIEAGGQVGGDNGRVGAGAFGGNSEALVTGPGSLWSSRTDLAVGLNPPNNRLVVSNGAAVVAGNNGRLGAVTGSTGNVVVVTGAGSLWSNRFELYVGEAGPGNRMEVNSGGSVVSGTTHVGNQSASNFALVTGAGSLWSNHGDLYVGNSSSMNQVVVSNGAAMFIGGDGAIGLNNNARSNLVTVTDPGTSLTMIGSVGFLRVGSNGPFNRLVITNGALLRSDITYVGAFSGSSNNVVVVTGPGSLWTNRFSVYIGFQSVENRLLVTNGGQLQSRNSTVGFNQPRNEAVVTGAGSLWNTTEDITIGLGGSRSQLVVSNGGAVTAGTIAILGSLVDFSADNRVTVNDGTLRVTNAPGTGTLDIRRGTNVLNAGLIDVDQLVLTNAQGFFEFNGGTLITRGAVISNNTAFVIGRSGATPAVWDVRAGVSNHVLSVDLQVGNNSSFNQLIVTNGALLATDHDGLIGINSAAKSNAVLIAGIGSRWTGSDEIYVGSNGALNRLVISNGGWVADAFGNLGRHPDSSNNLVVVTGTGSTWSNQFDLVVGNNGRGNQLVVTDGGVVRSEFGILGFNASGSNNSALVTGAGSVWSSSADLVIGRAGVGNQLVVSNGGGVVVTGSGTLGSNPGSSNNLTLVTGAGSVFTNALELFVGNDGSGNQLVVSNGAGVWSQRGHIGYDLGKSNVVVITGAGSVWSSSVELDVGRAGAGNQLVVSNGALIAAGTGFVGRNANANLNSVIVTDPGTQWLLSSNLYVGSNGALNRLVITNGARLENGPAAIGHGISSSNNEVVLTGASSIWSNRSSLYVGGSGSGNRLIVTNGGFLRSLLGELGNDAASRSNVVVITDAGSSWDMSSVLVAGSIGSGNRLVVSNGGWLRSVGSFIGFAGTNNEVLVTGAGSAWTNLGDLFVGHFGSGNLLVVTNGGEVFGVGGVIIGRDASSTNNRVTVDGGTLRAQDPGGTAFDVRRGTVILNAGLIEVDRLLLTNAGGFFQFHGGTLSSANSRVSHGTLFDIGKGTSPATFILAGNGLHEFTGILAARVASNATFTGNGTIGGAVPLQFFPGSRLVPGTSVGKMIFSNSPALLGTVVMEISKNGGTLTNDQLQVIAPLTYGGSLTVSNLGPTALAVGDRFPLFNAGSYAGGFTNIVLPPLSPGLGWTNKLLVDGSIEVVVGPQFTSISLSGTNVIFAGTGGIPNAPYAVLTATNVLEALSNWLSLVTNQFGPGGEFSFTNGIAPDELQRYFRIRTP